MVVFTDADGDKWYVRARRVKYLVQIQKDPAQFAVFFKGNEHDAPVVNDYEAGRLLQAMAALPA